MYDADGRYTLNGTVYNDLPSFLTAAGGTFSRASTATYFDSAGTLQTAAANAPRFDYDPVTHAPKGLLLEDARTNVLPWSEVTGVVAGTPGTLPTNWAWAQITPGFTVSVLGSGSENGLSYVDLRVAGTATATNRPLLRFGSFNSTTGARYTTSFWAKCLSASCPNINAYAGGTNGWGLDAASTPTQPLTATLTRYEFLGLAVGTGGRMLCRGLISMHLLRSAKHGIFRYGLLRPKQNRGCLPPRIFPQRDRRHHACVMC